MAIDCYHIRNSPIIFSYPIVIDPSTTAHNPTLDKARNGVPIINISTPNQAGISNNYFKEFNVDKGGIIFNNSKDLITPIQLAGLS